MTRIICLGVLLIIAISVKGVALENNSTDSLKICQGGESKGILISSVASAIVGAGLGAYDLGFEGGRTGALLPVISSGIGVAPSSLIGLLLGSAFAKDHSTIRNTFKFGVGITLSPIYLNTTADPLDVSLHAHYSPGLHIRMASPDINRWRYNVGFSHFSAKEYEFYGSSSFKGFTNLTRWEFDLNLQYIFPVGTHIELYPMVGTQYYVIRSAGNTAPNGKLQSEILTNYGAGVNVVLTKNTMLFSEFKSTLDPDPNPTKWSFSGGVYFHFNP